MAYSVNWTTGVITVPVSDLTLVSGVNYTLDSEAFWREMRRLEWTFTEGMAYPQAIEYVDSQLLSGLVYSPIVKLVNGYTWQTDGSNINVSIVGYNSNLLDFFNPGNGVSVLANNSAGKIADSGGGSGGGATAQEVWEYSSRTLTESAGVTPQDISDIADAVWNAVTKEVDLKTADINTITAQVWTETTRALTEEVGLVPAEVNAIAAAVWTETVRELTASGSTAITEQDKDDIVQRVWAYTRP